jgi:hypothetical protein
MNDMRPILLTLAAASFVTPLAAQQPAAPRPDTSGRPALIQFLDNLAADQTAARRETIAKILTLAAAKARQEQARATMLRLIGPLPPKTPLHPQILGETPLPGIRVQKILFDSQPNFHVTALMYLPDPLPNEKLPAILMAPGHGATGKTGDFAFAAAFARAGFAVLSYDPIGQGERLQYPDPADRSKSLAQRPTGEHGEAGLQPVLIGESVAKYFLFDGIRAIDYLQTRSEIDPTRIGAFGCSGGGADTALLGAIDTRLAAIGTACYLTSMDTLLPSIGPQDGEQSTPGWLVNGLDFPDYVELAAPRPYAIIATESDMFPFAGALTTEAESRRFYSLFPWSSSRAAEGSTVGPADTGNLVFIHGPGGHGNLRPIFPQILGFFEKSLGVPQTTSEVLKETPPPATFQVTETGQVATSYAHSATVYSLNLAHARNGIPHTLHSVSPEQFRDLIRKVTAVQAFPNSPPPPATGSTGRFTLATDAGIHTPVEFFPAGGKGPARLILRDSLDSITPEERAAYEQSAASGTGILVVCPRPSPPGTEELKANVLGPFYLLGLRAELVGRTLLGLRLDDVLQATDFLAAQPSVDPRQLSAEASGHLALVLLHAAALDKRLAHVTLNSLPPSFASVLVDPLPKDLPQDVLPGVIPNYDIPDLVRLLGDRVNPKTTPTMAPTSN